MKRFQSIKYYVGEGDTIHKKNSYFTVLFIFSVKKTPYAITIDDTTLDNNTITVRERDTMQQVRVAIDELKSYLLDSITKSTFHYPYKI